MKFIFIVQGEGRGHMTQALSLFQMLIKAEHEVCHVIVGKSKRRTLPDFFVKQLSAPITQLESPNFITDRNSRSINLFKSLIFNLRNYRTFLRSIDEIDKIVRSYKADAIINFYDFLGGLYFLIKKPGIRHLTLAHQYLLNHRSFEFPKGRFYDKSSILLGNRIAGYGAEKILGLSFQPMADEPDKKLVVVPPLLREKVKLQQPTHQEHFLVYMVNHGYSEEVMAFHKLHPQLSIHCFWDKKGAPKTLKVDDTLTFHQLDDELFISFMASCQGYLTTAGFESVCEAMYLGKPVLMVPVEGHYEQVCNALDASKAGAGISSEVFDLGILLNYLPSHKEVGEDFRKWVSTSEEAFLKALT